MFWLNDLRKKPPKSNNNSNNNPVFVRGVRRGGKRLFLVDRNVFVLGDRSPMAWICLCLAAQSSPCRDSQIPAVTNVIWFIGLPTDRFHARAALAFDLRL
jgi:hypothetical protein